MYNKPWKTYLSDIVSRISTSTVLSLSEVVQFVKADIIVISVHLKLSNLFVISHVSSAKVSSEWRLNRGLGTQKSVPFPE